jgi:nitroimidazol reductase NimA-like FMN-containing flavoprotein (pyridoxamine 5'-phosphate oxidase superfamily)
MSAKECSIALANAGFGRLACVRNDRAYIVPLYLAAREDTIYAFSMSGQKIDWMRENPHVCVEIDSVENAGDWSSVIARGLYQELSDTPEHESERALARQLLQRRATWWEPGALPVEGGAEPRLHREPIIFCIHLSEVTGHRRVTASARE